MNLISTYIKSKIKNKNILLIKHNLFLDINNNIYDKLYYIKKILYFECIIRL